MRHVMCSSSRYLGQTQNHFQCTQTLIYTAVQVKGFAILPGTLSIIIIIYNAMYVEEADKYILRVSGCTQYITILNSLSLVSLLIKHITSFTAVRLIHVVQHSITHVKKMFFHK